MSEMGHNSSIDKQSARHLLAFVQRIERLQSEEDAIKDDKAEVYGEAKSMGYDKKVLKRVVAARRKDPQVREEEDLIFDTYMNALESVSNPEGDDE